MIAPMRYVAPIYNTEAVPIAVEGWHALIAAGLAQRHVLLNHDQHAVVAYAPDGVPSGVIVADVAEWRRSYVIILGYVRPAFRRRGLYRAMFGRLVVAAQERGLALIEGATHPDNEPMRATMAALHRKPVGIVYQFEVPPGGGRGGSGK